MRLLHGSKPGRSYLGASCQQLPRSQSLSFVSQVVTVQGERGILEGRFGKSGKFNVQFPTGVTAPAAGSNSVRLTFKKFIFDKNKRHMAQ